MPVAGLAAGTGTAGQGHTNHPFVQARAAVGVGAAAYAQGPLSLASPADAALASMLGNGQYSAFVYDRGGTVVIGRLTNIEALTFARLRDDISGAQVQIERPSPTDCTWLTDVRSVRHELVIFRNGKRVWEGPITRIEFSATGIIIDAKDVLWFASKRAQSRGLDYSGGSVPVLDVVETLLEDVYDAPQADWCNVMPYLTKITGPEDARTATKVPAYSRTVWETVDGFAMRGGVDYTVVGRRILWWDTHVAITQINPLRDEHFAGPIVLTEYGADLRTRDYFTNSSNVVTTKFAPQEWIDYYGWIDRVNTDTEDEQGDGGNDPEAGETVELDRGYPAPLVIRVPENTGLSPRAPVTFDELIPGTWVPIRTTQVCRDVQQWMKLDKVQVSVAAGVETVGVSFVTAPARKDAPVTIGGVAV